MLPDTRRSILQGLYVITDADLIGGDRLVPSVKAALAGGARIVQYRDKGTDHDRRKKEASELLQLCRQAQAPLIINDDVTLAADIDADGVHLGHGDTDAAEARAILGEQAIIGVSCYADPYNPHARHADYAAFGRFFDSTTKPDASPAPLSVLSEARGFLDIPIAAIGGIHAGNAQEVITAGADMLAVVAGVFAAEDIQLAAARISTLVKQRTAE